MEAAQNIHTHWQLRDQQLAAYQKVANMELLPDNEMCTALDYGETRGAPRVPGIATEDYFAGAHLASSIFVRSVWTSKRQTWYILLSRVTESGAFAGACIKECLRHEDFTEINKRQSFSDGPAQSMAHRSLAAKKRGRSAYQREEKDTS